MNEQAAVEFLFRRVAPERIDALGEICEALGAMAVSVLTDPAERAFAEPGIETAPLTLPADLSAHFEPDSDVDALRAALADAFPLLPPLTVNRIAATDWNAAAAARSESSIVANRIWIGPDHAAAPPERDLLTVSINPGLAFGTGTHPTTRLVAAALVEHEASIRGGGVIDYGCGSAVLAIVAARLGAARIAAIDIDPVACEVARHNVVSNGASHIEVGGVDDLPAWRADVLVANILLAPLVDLAPVFARCIREGGLLLLAGVLMDQADECLAAYAPFFTMGPVRNDDEWVLLSGRRNSAPATAAPAGAGDPLRC